MNDTPDEKPRGLLTKNFHCYQISFRSASCCAQRLSQLKVLWEYVHRV